MGTPRTARTPCPAASGPTDGQRGSAPRSSARTGASLRKASTHGPSPNCSWRDSSMAPGRSEAVLERSAPSPSTSISPAPSTPNSPAVSLTARSRAASSPVSTGSTPARRATLLARASGAMGIGCHCTSRPQGRLSQAPLRHVRAGSGPSPEALPAGSLPNQVGDVGRLQVDELAAHALDGPAQQPRDVHLGDLHAGRDLVLGQLLDVAKQDDP